ncbi:MAG TPA: DoxX family membrane protein [Propioniciclava sp.]|jgi:uncharacterized membrane protein YphA (DoxX/SURF4 family)|uniref:DoxX family membrane protein n=1 Tax=Propioniciclava sp. TaxID=2038686 RepID=UPI002CDC605B|nr:DoxX family membrane protein [Propioniciclava sp.]HRL50025.1 DoxX family membrane protein [Propioniciclava sp.]HRL80172.1 DoxX family membrane protein [Propioniciclava sp.]
MNLVRGVGRLLLGGFYIVNGVKTLKDPARYAAQVEPVLDRVVPLARKAVGTGAADYIPENPETLARVNGGLSLLGGLGIATGIGRRAGGGLAAASMLTQVLARVPEGATEIERAEAKVARIRDLALLGAALIVTQDTAGRPSIAWRAADARRRLTMETEQAKKRARKETKRLKASAKRGAKQIRAGLEGSRA